MTRVALLAASGAFVLTSAMAASAQGIVIGGRGIGIGIGIGARRNTIRRCGLTLRSRLDRGVSTGNAMKTRKRNPRRRQRAKRTRIRPLPL